jgi:uncharacterized protein (TIGR02246 family)
MPAYNPADIHHLFEQAFNLGDAGALTALYEPGAILVIGGNEVTGRDSIRKAFESRVATRARMTLETLAVVSSSSGLAMLHGAWVIEPSTGNGSEPETRGLSTEIVRKQPDGTWLFVIDNPYTPERGNSRVVDAELLLPTGPAEEAAPFYRDFLAAFPDGRVGLHLQTQVPELRALCGRLSDSEAMFRYANDKWTIKEVVGHLLDTERVFAYRLLRISRNDSTALPGCDDTLYVQEGRFNARSIGDLLSEFELQRTSTMALASGIPPLAWTRVGTANGFATSARALVYIILGHTAHHLSVLQERYGLPRR